MREGDTFGATVTVEADPSVAIFVPRGVGNSYQALEDGTAYSYLVNDHWSPDATYTFLNLADETVGIDWPIPLDSVAISAKVSTPSCCPLRSRPLTSSSSCRSTTDIRSCSSGPVCGRVRSEGA